MTTPLATAVLRPHPDAQDGRSGTGLPSAACRDSPGPRFPGSLTQIVALGYFLANFRSTNIMFTSSMPLLGQMWANSGQKHDADSPVIEVPEASGGALSGFR